MTFDEMDDTHRNYEMSTDNKLIVKDKVTEMYHEVAGLQEVDIDQVTGQVVAPTYKYGAHDYTVDEWRARRKRSIRCTVLQLDPVNL